MADVTKISGVAIELITKIGPKAKSAIKKIAGREKPAVGSHIFSNGTYTLSGDEWRGTQVFTIVTGSSGELSGGSGGQSGGQSGASSGGSLGGSSGASLGGSSGASLGGSSGTSGGSSGASLGGSSGASLGGSSGASLGGSSGASGGSSGGSSGGFSLPNSLSCGSIPALDISSITVTAGLRSGFDIAINGMTRANSTFNGTGNGSTLTFALRGVDNFTITYTT
jgi:hypothetical protein